MKNIMFFLVIVSLISDARSGDCHGKFINPITDVCWSCIFPLSIGSKKMGSRKDRDSENPSSAFCRCPGKAPNFLPIPGLAIGFWEPVRLVDITMKPYCFVGLGGLKIGGGSRSGAISSNKNKGKVKKKASYHIHYYVYPLLYWMELLNDFACAEKMSFDVAYLSELDPTHNNEKRSLLMHPEAIVFNNPIAEAACAVDCVKSSASTPVDKMFWCNGCQGGLYPFTEVVTAFSGGVNASMTLIGKIIAKLHRMGVGWETSGERALCGKKLAPFIKKSQYRAQMLYPHSVQGDDACLPIGASTLKWGALKEYPGPGESFSFLIWRKRNCCLKIPGS